MRSRAIFFVALVFYMAFASVGAAPSPQIVLERDSFNLPEDGQPMNNARVGPFCCTGDITIVRTKNGDPLGYIYFLDMDNAYNIRGEAVNAYNMPDEVIAESFAVLVSGAERLDKPGAKQVEGRIPFHAAHFNPQSGWVQVGALQYRATVLNFAFVRRNEDAKPYFRLMSLDVRVDVRIKGGNSVASTPVYRIRDGQLEITGTAAYTWTCREGSTAEVKTAQGWRAIRNATLPTDKPFYLDGELRKRVMYHCDVVICRPYANFPARTDSISEEIFMSGTRQPGNIPEFKRRQVKGDIRATVPYHTDAACKPETLQKAVFEFKR